MEQEKNIGKTDNQVILDGLIIDCLPSDGRVTWRNIEFPKANNFIARDVTGKKIDDIETINIVFDAMAAGNFFFVDKGTQYLVKKGLIINFPEMKLVAKAEMEEQYKKDSSSSPDSIFVMKAFFRLFKGDKEINISKFETCFDVRSEKVLIVKMEFSPRPTEK